MDKTKNLGTVGKIIIPNNVQQIIDNLHSQIGSTEWSGILFYKMTKGNIRNMKNLEFKAEFIYPMNIGSHTYTEFDYSGKIMDAYDIREDLIGCDTGMSHTHHNMAAFFSSTDSSELIDNAKHYNYYLSIIFSFDRDYKCKVAFPSKTEVTYNSIIKDSEGNNISVKNNSEEDLILIGDLEVVSNNKLKSIDWLNDRIKELKVEKNKPVQTYKYGNNFHNYGLGFDDDFITSYGKPKKTENIEDFLKKLITLDSKQYYHTVKAAIDGITEELKKTNTSYDEYEISVENNIEIIHDNIFGKSGNLRENLLKAALKLEELGEKYEDNEVCSILKSNLLYAV